MLVLGTTILYDLPKVLTSTSYTSRAMTLFKPCEGEISVFNVRFALDFGAGAYMTQRDEYR